MSQQQPPPYDYGQTPYPAQQQGYGYPPQQPPQQPGFGYGGGYGPVPQQQPPQYGAPPQQQYGPPPAGWNAPPPMPPPIHQGVYQSGYDGDAEAPKPSGALSFDDKSIRRGFIRKVFGILAIQLLLVTVMIAFFLFYEPAKLFVRRNSWLYWISYAVFIVTYLALGCCPSVRRKHPGNLICLVLLTLAIGYMTAMISSFYDIPVVFLAMAICAGSCTAVVIFAMQTKFDFTKLTGVMCVVFMVVFLFGIVAIIFVYATGNPILYVVYAGLMALVFMVYLAIDVQMLMGGRKFEIGPEDYVFAAAQIFLDIIYIFWFMLTIVGFASNN